MAEFTVKVKLDAEVSAKHISQDLMPDSYTLVLHRLYVLLSRRFPNGITLSNFPLCVPDTSLLNPFQIKAEIDKMCLLCSQLQSLPQSDRDFLQACYLVANYITGCVISPQIFKSWGHSARAKEVAKMIIDLIGRLKKSSGFTNCPPLDELLRQLADMHFDTATLGKNVDLNDYAL